MKQRYLDSLLIIGLLLFSVPAQAQVSSPQPPPQEVEIEGLSIFPNPASGQKIYINTRTGSPKTVEVYNVLGKNILSANLTGNELNISSLEPGIYILRIREGKATATRKLVVR